MDRFPVTQALGCTVCGVRAKIAVKRDVVGEENVWIGRMQGGNMARLRPPDKIIATRYGSGITNVVVKREKGMDIVPAIGERAYPYNLYAKRRRFFMRDGASQNAYRGKDQDENKPNKALEQWVSSYQKAVYRHVTALLKSSARRLVDELCVET